MKNYAANFFLPFFYHPKQISCSEKDEEKSKQQWFSIISNQKSERRLKRILIWDLEVKQKQKKHVC
jgi:hypothetical protein